jgi:hypothetical protein
LANHRAVITDTSEALDAWCPPDLHAVAGVALPVGGVDDPDRQPQDPALDLLEGGEVEVAGQAEVLGGAAHGRGCYVSAPGGPVGT